MIGCSKLETFAKRLPQCGDMKRVGYYGVVPPELNYTHLLAPYRALQLACNTTGQCSRSAL